MSVIAEYYSRLHYRVHIFRPDGWESGRVAADDVEIANAGICTIVCTYMAQRTIMPVMLRLFLSLSLTLSVCVQLADAGYETKTCVSDDRFAHNPISYYYY